MGLDGPELEPDDGPDGPGEKLRRLAGDGGDPALPRPRLYVSDPLNGALSPSPRPKWSRLRLRDLRPGSLEFGGRYLPGWAVKDSWRSGYDSWGFEG